MAVGESYNKTKAFSYLSRVSDEKTIQAKEILEIAKKLKNNSSFLDIGAGSGDIFFKVSKNFKESVAIEPGKRMLEILKSNSRTNGPRRTEIIGKTWDEFYNRSHQKYENHFDLIINVHTIYFFENPVSEIKRMLTLLKKDGVLVIIQGYIENPRKDFISKFRHDFLGTPYFNNRRYSLIKRSFGSRHTSKFIDTRFFIQDFKDLEKNHLSEKSASTNYFLKFAIKKWFDELSEEQKRSLLKYLEPLKMKDKYVIQNKQVVQIIRK